MCSLSNSMQESTTHLFLECTFAMSIWQWLISIPSLQCNFTTIHDAIQLCQRNWSPLCKIDVLSDLINCLNTIWFCRNRLRFADKKISHRSSINIIIFATAMTGNNSNLAANSSIADFVILKALSVKINHGNAPRIKEVIWQHPIFNWIKCNVDGASNENAE